MARPKAKTPAISYHLSGQAICQINGVTFYLGPHGSPESLARYAVLIREYQKNGCAVPPGLTSQTLQELTEGFALENFDVHLDRDPIKVQEVTAAYLGHAATYYAKDPVIRNRIQKVCQDIDELAGTIEASKFGPVLLGKVRASWVQAGVSRNYANALTQLAIRIFRWAASVELVAVDIPVALRMLEPLRKGKTTARETEPVKAVPLEHVRATAKHLSPVLRAMVRVQVSTAMRPTELCQLRPCEIDRSGEVWLYKPEKHKTASRGKNRVIPIIGDAREAITEYLNRPAKAYLFSPKEAVAWHNAQKRATRKTKVQPSQVDRSKENPKVAPGECYNKDSYRRALQRAAKVAGVPSWHPYQIRHLSLTEISEALSLEHASAIGGHSDIATTSIYAKQHERKAIEAAKHAPKL